MTPRRYPVQPLLVASGLSLSALARRVGIGGGEYARVRSEGVSELAADRWANRLGLHPAEVWPDWFDEAKVPCANDRCANLFVPTRRNHVYCTQKCARAVWARTDKGKASLAAAKTRWLETAREYDRKRERERKRRIRAQQRQAA